MSRLLDVFLFQPVAPETKNLLRDAHQNLPEPYKSGNQWVGRHYVGCGATIGVMPRCDFACRGCYLGSEANRIQPESVAAIKQQLRVIRDWLGEGGNVQITDGEASLRPLNELSEMIGYAREIGLVPMLMSHGDTFRKTPDSLKRLMVEAGLSEVSIHIDTTQRGRSGAAFRKAQTEEALMPLRDEFARLIRKLRRETGRTLEAASTITVTDQNIAEIPEVIRWLLHNADAFKMISFQPVAQVGRTEQNLGATLTVDRLWERIAEGLYGDPKKAIELSAHHGLFGHPACTRFVQGIVLRSGRSDPRFYPLFRGDDPDAMNFIDSALEILGGLSLRRRSGIRKLRFLTQILLKHPGFILGSVVPFALKRLREIDGSSALRLLFAWCIGATRIHYLNIVSHHFMNREEIDSPLGRERIDACVFKVPIHGSLVSMCEVNALGYRKRYYESIGQPVLTEANQNQAGTNSGNATAVESKSNSQDIARRAGVNKRSVE